MLLIGQNLFGVLVVLIFEALIKRLWPEFSEQTAFGAIAWGQVLGLIVLTPLIVVFTEILPKAFFRAHADKSIPRMHGLLRTWILIFSPAIWVIQGLTRLLFGKRANQRAMRQLSRQDVINLLEAEEEEEAAEPAREGTAEEPRSVSELLGEVFNVHAGEPAEMEDERRMVQNIIELDETHAYEIMTPLVSLAAVRLGSMNVEDFKRLALETGFSRFPVYRTRIVHIEGYIDIYRVLREETPTSRLKDFIEPPFFVPEAMRVDDLLQAFLKHRVKNAVVVNEHGGASGWISREDILEEIVGELEDELDEVNDQIKQVAEGVYEIDARVEIDRLNEALDEDFPDEDYETLAGLILEQLGRLPEAGETLALQGWNATILAMEGPRIDRVQLERPRTENPEASGGAGE